MFIEFHVHPLTAKLHSFHAESKALLRGSLTAEFDLAACAHNALPRYGVEGLLLQQTSHGPVIQRIACSSGNLAVGRNFALGDGTNDAAKGGIALFIFAQCILKNSSLEVLRNIQATHAQNYIKSAGLFRVARTGQNVGLDRSHLIRLQRVFERWHP